MIISFITAIGDPGGSRDSGQLKCFIEERNKLACFGVDLGAFQNVIVQRRVLD